MHPRFGTRNFILPLSGGTYVEVVTTLDHPAADRAPFGQAVARRAVEGGGWLGWVVSVDDIAPVETRLGRTSTESSFSRPPERAAWMPCAVFRRTLGVWSMRRSSCNGSPRLAVGGW
ncbi:VOC family protein [Streptomyces goshikiensis]|uniref:VOC family protein n=1 Tax=Streptomyces goshikiensis TaxID=1942 RepID=UPI003692371E